MQTTYRQGYNLAEGFEKAAHQIVTLLSLGVPLDSLETAKTLLTVAGWEVIDCYHSRVAHNKRIYDWVNIEAYASGSSKTLSQFNTLATSLNYSPGVSVYNLTAVHFWQQLTYGSVGVSYSDRNKNYWVPVEGELPFGIDSAHPDAYTFIGLSDVLAATRIPAIVLHTAPEIPIHRRIYPKADLTNRTAGVCYLTPAPRGEWIYSITGKGLLDLLENPVDLAGWLVPDDDVQYLLSESPRVQFAVSLVARAWRNKYGDMSADIFRSIIRYPFITATKIDYDLNRVLDRFFKQ